MNLQTINTAAPPPTASPMPVSAKSFASTESSSTKPTENSSEHSQPVNQAQLQDAIKATNDFVKPINSTIEFSMDKDAGELVVKVVDNTTKEVIRQIPSEEMLIIAKALDKIQGLLIRQKA